MSDVSQAVRALVLDRSQGLCERDWCGPADHVHHRHPRQMGGTRLAWVNRAGNLLHLAYRCHAWVETQERALAESFGWLVPMGVDPLTVPVVLCSPTLGRSWVLLRDDGGLVPTDGPVDIANVPGMVW